MSRPDTEALQARVAELERQLAARGRRGRGRPALGAAKRSKMIRVSVTPEMEAQVLESASTLQQTPSDWGLAAFEARLAMTTPDQDQT